MLWRYDFDLFYLGGQAVLTGRSPYEMFDFNGPFPLAVLFAPLALLPEPLAYTIYILINLALLYKVLGPRKLIWPLFSFPILFALFVGQVDLLFSLAVLNGGPWTLPLVLLAKPQLGIVLLPWFLPRMGRKDFLEAAITGACLLAVSFLLRPGWVSEWLAGSPGLKEYSYHASNLYWLIPADFRNWRTTIMLIGSILALLVCFLLKDRETSWTVLHLFGPLTNIYSPSILAEWIGPVEVLISWVAIFSVGGRVHTGAPLFLIGITILFRKFLKNYKDRSL